jgi:hypothetical protein
MRFTPDPASQPLAGRERGCRGMGSFVLCSAVDHFRPGMVEAKRITDHQGIAVHAIHLTYLCVTQA